MKKEASFRGFLAAVLIVCGTLGARVGVDAAADPVLAGSAVVDPVSELQPLVDELGPKLGPVTDAASFVDVYGDAVKRYLGMTEMGRYPGRLSDTNRFTVYVDLGCVVDPLGASIVTNRYTSLVAPGPRGGQVALRVWAIDRASSGECGGGGHGGGR